jgi:ribosomal protein L37E
MATAQECEPVVAGGQCPVCEWPNGKSGTRGFRGEPHPVHAHGVPKVKIENVCANCGAAWNLDTVECSTCGWKPKDPTMEDKLIADKNAILKRMASSRMLPPRPQVIEPVKEMDPKEA